jgi:hypothetical protein
LRRLHALEAGVRAICLGALESSYIVREHILVVLERFRDLTYRRNGRWVREQEVEVVYSIVVDCREAMGVSRQGIIRISSGFAINSPASTAEAAERIPFITKRLNRRSFDTFKQ